jgi:hypothetical protein
MILSDMALADPFVCFILNTASLLLLLYLHFMNWTILFEESTTALEYFIPALSAFFVYALTSAFCYHIRFSLYMWFFLPTRFLEPKLNSQYAHLSFLAAHALLFLVIFIVPIWRIRKRKLRIYR